MGNVKQRKKKRLLLPQKESTSIEKKRESDVIVPPVARQRYSISFTSQLTGYVDTAQYNTEQRRKKFLLLSFHEKWETRWRWRRVKWRWRVPPSCSVEFRVVWFVISSSSLFFFVYIRKHKQSIIYSQWDSSQPTTTANSPSIYIVIMLLPAHRRAVPHSIYANTPWTSLSAFSLDAYVRRDASWWDSFAYPWGPSWHWGHREVSANVWTS